jgi:hypothetical protein
MAVRTEEPYVLQPVVARIAVHVMQRDSEPPAAPLFDTAALARLALQARVQKKALE